MAEFFSNAQVWTVILSGVAGFIGAVSPILVARYQAVQAKLEVDKAAAAASVQIKANARKDAVGEWQALYGERQTEVRELRTELTGVKAQNADQQEQLNELKDQHADCEDRHAALEKKVESLTGAVSKITNGGA